MLKPPLGWKPRAQLRRCLFLHLSVSDRASCHIVVCCAELAWFPHAFLIATLGLLQSQCLCQYDNAVIMARRCLLLTDWALWSGVQAQA